jgi:hypothetical protein
MKPKNFPALPKELTSVREQFERWRRGRRGRSRIPEGLWASAAEVAAQHGVSRTAQALGLDYYALGRRVAASKGDGGEPTGAPAAATFVELVPARAGGGVAECVVELESCRGSKMRIHLRGAGAAELSALSRSFWEGQS